MPENFDLQPTLRGPRVTIRPVSVEDWAPLFRAAADPQIWTLHPVPDRYKEDVFRKFFNHAIASQSAFVFVDTQSGDIFGSSRYHGYDPARREIEIGWTFMVRKYWGGSYNAEIKKLMLDHAFRFVNNVTFWVGESNLRSRRAMEKIGGVLRPGTTTRALSGKVPYVIYDIVKPC